MSTIGPTDPENGSSHHEAAPGDGSLLYLEFGSVSFKASYFPRGKDNDILVNQGSGIRRLRNLLCLTVYRNQPVTKEALSAVIDWLQEIYHWAKTEASPKADEVLVVATAAFRDMHFFGQLQEAVYRIFGTTRIITLEGYLEAQLLMDSYEQTSQQYPNAPTVLFDLGGGSLEIVWVENDSRYFTTLKLGSGRVTAWMMDGLSRREIRERIEGAFKQNCQLIKARSPGMWYATGGAVKSFNKAFNLREYEPLYRFHISRERERITAALFDGHGRIKEEVLETGFDGLLDSAPEQLNEHRKRIYVGGLEVLDIMCRHFDIEAIRLDNVSVRRGVVKRMQLLRATPLK